jgi:hypothetical protein
MALLPSDRNNTTMSSTRTTTTAILVGATCGIIGVVVGLAIPSILKRLTLAGVIRSSKNDTTTTTTTTSSEEEGCKSATITDGSDGTHSVRSGLKNDSSSSIRISQSKLNSFLSTILIKAATTTTTTTTTSTATTTGGDDDDRKLKEKMELVASVLTYADSRGIPSHGSNRCDTYVNEIVAGLVNATADPL